MTIKTKSGRLKTEDELREEVIEELVEVLEELDEDDALELGNAYRRANRDAELMVNDEDNLNSELEGRDPYEILQMASDWNEYDGYFSCDSWCDFGTTDNVWENVDLDDLADDIIEGDYRPYTTNEIQEIVEEYEKAVEELRNYNEGRIMAEEVIRKFVNCEADVTDLLQTLEKLVRTDEYWKKED